MNNIKTIVVAAAVAAVVALVIMVVPSLFAPKAGALPLSKLGYNAVADQGFTIQTATSNGTRLTNLVYGTCFFKPWAATIAASSTALVECQGTSGIGSSTGTFQTSALTGVTSGDTFFMAMSTSTAGSAQSNGIAIIGAIASTTAPGYIQMLISNMTGATYTWPTTGVASGTATYIDIH